MDSSMKKVLSNAAESSYPNAVESAVSWTLHERDRLSLEEIAQLWTKDKEEQELICKGLITAAHGDELSVDWGTLLTKDDFSYLERVDPLALGHMCAVLKEDFLDYLKREEVEISGDCLLNRWFYDSGLDRPGVEIRRLMKIHEKYRRTDSAGNRTTAGLAKVFALAIRSEPEFNFELPAIKIEDIYESLRWAKREIGRMPPDMGMLGSISTFRNDYWKKVQSRKEVVKKLRNGKGGENLLKMLKNMPKFSEKNLSTKI